MKQLLLLPLSLLLFISCVRLPVYQAKTEEVAKDSTILRYYDAESRVLFDVYENGENIYLKLQTSYYYSQVKILKLGLTVWLDQKSKKHEDIGIAFPLKTESNKGSMRMNSMGGSNSNQLIMTQLHNEFLLSPKYMELIGIDGLDERKEVYSNLKNSDIKVTITFDSLNRLNYLAVFPKEWVFRDEKNNNKQFSIGVESGYKDVDFSKMNQGQQGGGGKGHGGGGGMGGGQKGRRGGSQAKAGNMQQRTALTNPIKFWFSVKLTKSADISNSQFI